MQGMVERFENELTDFFNCLPDGVWMNYLDSGYERLMLHAVSQYLSLKSKSESRLKVVSWYESSFIFKLVVKAEISKKISNYRLLCEGLNAMKSHNFAGLNINATNFVTVLSSCIFNS